MRDIKRSAGTTGAKHRARSLWAIAAIGWLVVAAPAPADEVVVGTVDGDCACCVLATIHVPVPSAVAWRVLTDYDHIQDFVESIDSSRVDRPGPGRMVVHQVATGRWFVMSRRVRVTLEIEEEEGRRIRFHDVLGKDFVHYAGEWRISSEATGTRVDYQLDAQPRAGFARAFCRGTLRRTARELLEQVRAELLRRAAAGR